MSISCGCKLTHGSEVGEFERSRRAHNDIEERIWDCEECVGLFWVLEEYAMLHWYGDWAPKRIVIPPNDKVD